MIKKHFSFILIILLNSITINAQSSENGADALAANETAGTSTGKENSYLARITRLEKQAAALETRLNTIIETKNLITYAPKNASLEQNKPNPVSDYTTIRYKLPPGCNGEIIIYNQQGNIVKTIFANESCHTAVNVKDMVPGIYTYILMVNGKATLAQQMMVIR